MVKALGQGAAGLIPSLAVTSPQVHKTEFLSILGGVGGGGGGGGTHGELKGTFIIPERNPLTVLGM